jgi:2,4'-dihydroxyacetophenone dioxygenase
MDDVLTATLHRNCDDLPWTPAGEGLEQRVLHARPDEGFVVVEIKAQPGVRGALHRHLAPVLGFTRSGRWGHDESFDYRPGSYIFETPNVLHRFLTGSEPVDAFFVSYGDQEVVDPDTLEVLARLDVRTQLAGYFAACEDLGQPRPNVLR